MAIGPRTFLDELISLANGENIVHHSATAYPVLSREEILRRQPDVIIATSDIVHSTTDLLTPYPEWKSLDAVQRKQVAASSTPALSAGQGHASSTACSQSSKPSTPPSDFCSDSFLLFTFHSEYIPRAAIGFPQTQLQALTTMTDSSKSLFVAVAGNIGAGKSSLTRLLSEHFGWNPYFESVDDNPYLPDFYADMKRWSFHLQIYFLANRFKHHKRMTESGEPVIQDRSIYEDAEIFARNLHDIGKMDDRDYSNYVSLFQVMTDYLKSPDLMVYLRASVDTLIQQISRSRALF